MISLRPYSPGQPLMHRKTARYRAAGLGYFSGIDIHDLPESSISDSTLFCTFAAWRLFVSLGPGGIRFAALTTQARRRQEIRRLWWRLRGHLKSVTLHRSLPAGWERR